ncbi:glycosyltransferase family 2 protein [Candidatus Microgenomates bacterium]|nr:glycosyltransferase family 2 protein [Candidatus Microgenomates bacterium]
MGLSVTLATHNEEANLGRCLAAIRQLADEIIIADGRSMDKTRAIAKRFGAQIIDTPNLKNFHKMKKLANDAAHGDWILQLDADEVVTPALRDEIKRTISASPRQNGFWIPRANYFLGRFLKKGGAYPDYTLRLYRRGFGNLPAENVHEQAVVAGAVGHLKNNLQHYSCPTFGVYIERRFNRYTDLMAPRIKGGFIRNVFWNFLFDREQGFLTIYVRHLGFLDGFPGFVWALFSGLHYPIAYFKSLYDLHRSR